MSFQLRHTLASKSFLPKRKTDGEKEFFIVDEQGEFFMLFPGQLNRAASATFTHRIKIDAVGAESVDGEGPRPGSTPLHGGFDSKDITVDVTMRVFAPDGREFTAPEITVADLKKFRDLRGSPSGPWSYRVTGESEHILVDEDSKLVNPKGTLGLRVIETVASESAPPLVNVQRLGPGRQSFPFDLFRVGTFVAEISQPALGAQWRGSLRLLDPDGIAVAETAGKKLSFPVALGTLNKSRDPNGRIRNWTLEVSPRGVTNLGAARLSATVIGSGRITIAALTSRIDALLGPRGSFIQIFGENKDGKALGRLRITDIASAETVDMYGLLDSVLTDEDQDGGANPSDFQPDTVYTIASRSQALKAGLELDVSTLKVGTIDVAVGPGVRLGASVPSIRLTVAVSGAAKIEFHGATLATAKVRNGKFDLEVGMKLGPDGTPRIVTEVPDSPFDIDISTAVKAALVLTLGVGGLIAGMGVTEYIEQEINQAIAKGARRLFSEPTLAPSILMMLFGAHLSYKPIRIEGGDIVFDHVAPIEPDPKPRPGYQGAIGRSFTQLGPRAVSFFPRTVPDTWRAANLDKIDHIVVVMMENRSYDHVLGYRAQAPINDGANGLTDELIAAIEAAPNPPSERRFDVRRLREAGFARNEAGLMTRFPRDLGHGFRDVAEQLSVRTPGPGDKQINSPKGFVDNFLPRLKTNAQGLVPDDALGFYDEQDLPFLTYLAENYSYSDRYYCSHPGPTLPNRMYSLTGDVQYDRYGFPILENNNGDNFLLSRAPTIYDLLARRGLGFRVYESNPSVTMLRMFARYATDTTNIVPLDRLAADVARGDLPPLTAIEPQMHAHPQDDDHPDADMLRGQQFLKNVYDTLRSNPAVWEKTLLIITYDEHGGFYDHVVPAVADLLSPQGELVLDPGTGGTVGPGGGSPPGTGPRRPGLAAVSTSLASTSIATGGPTSSASPPDAGLLQIPYGVRVPTFVVSPWTTRGKGPSVVLDHCSILKSVLARFWGDEKPFLSDRVSASNTFDAFLTEVAPRMDVPPSPSLPTLPLGVRRAPSSTTRIVTDPLSRAQLRKGPVDYHLLTGRWARQLGR